MRPGSRLEAGERPLARTALDRKANPLDDGVQDVCQRLPAAAVPDYSYQPEVGVSFAVLEPVAAGFLPCARRVTLLTHDLLKSESGRFDPPRQREQSREKEADTQKQVRRYPWLPRESE